MPEARLGGRPVGDWLAATGRAGLTRMEPPGWFQS